MANTGSLGLRNGGRLRNCGGQSSGKEKGGSRQREVNCQIVQTICDVGSFGDGEREIDKQDQDQHGNSQKRRGKARVSAAQEAEGAAKKDCASEVGPQYVTRNLRRHYGGRSIRRNASSSGEIGKVLDTIGRWKSR